VSTDLLRDLPFLLDMLQTTCAEVGSAVAGRYFHHTAALAWTAET
jgi:hypothetical protein